MGSEEGSIMRNFIVCTVYLIFMVIKSKRLMGRACKKSDRR